jgi:hypothetical protein
MGNDQLGQTAYLRAAKCAPETDSELLSHMVTGHKMLPQGQPLLAATILARCARPPHSPTSANMTQER